MASCKTGSMTPDLHPDIAHLGFLLGRWRGTGAGEYPTIESFTYVEEVTFGHVGKPFLTYSQKTRNAETDLPLHAEAGYLRPVGLDRVELVVAQPSGIVEVDEGSIVEVDERSIVEVDEAAIGAHRIELESATVAATGSAKAVSAVRRVISVVGDELSYEVDMAAVGLEMQHHLRATLVRSS